MAGQTTTRETSRRRTRSSHYPHLPLDAAIELVRKIAKLGTESTRNKEVFGAALCGDRSSGYRAQVFACLRYYGLVQEASDGQISLTARAKRLLEAQAGSEFAVVAREAALGVRIFKAIVNHFGAGSVSRTEVEDLLMRRSFTSGGSCRAAKCYESTRRYLASLDDEAARGFPECKTPSKAERAGVSHADSNASGPAGPGGADDRRSSTETRRDDTKAIAGPRTTAVRRDLERHGFDVIFAGSVPGGQRFCLQATREFGATELHSVIELLRCQADVLERNQVNVSDC